MIILSAGARLSGLPPMLNTHSRQACRVAGPRLRLLWRAAPSSGFLAGKHGGDSAMAFFPGSLCCLAPGSGIPPAAARSFPGARKQITRRSGPVQKGPWRAARASIPASGGVLRRCVPCAPLMLLADHFREATKMVLRLAGLVCPGTPSGSRHGRERKDGQARGTTPAAPVRACRIIGEGGLGPPFWRWEIP